MSKKVKVTWLSEGKTIIDECFLVSDTDTFYSKEPDSEIVSGDLDFLDEFAKDGKVIFEDEKGVFGLRAEWILNIEEID